MARAVPATLDVPETPWDLVAAQRNVVRRLWNRDFSLQPPVLKLGWNWRSTLPEGVFENYDIFTEAKRRVEDPDFDVRCQLEVVRHEIECLECGAEVGIPLTNTPAFDLIHFGTAPLATAFGARMILRDGSQPAYEPAVHSPREVLRLKKPNLLKDGILPQILERIQYYNDRTQGKVMLTPTDTSSPWSVATSIWHYEDMLEAIYTAPEAVHYLLDMVTDCMIEWYNIQETYIGRWGRSHSSGSWLFWPRGLGIADDCMVTVSPAAWEKFFMPYNNRLSREYGHLAAYHCCLRYDTYFESLARTDGFMGFDAAPEYNDLDKIESTLTRNRGIWFCMLGPRDLDVIQRLRGKIGMLFAVNGTDREDAIRQTKRFLAALAHPRRRSSYVTRWRLSRLMPAQEIEDVTSVRLSDSLDWTLWSATPADRSFVNVNRLFARSDGIVYAGNRFRVDQPRPLLIYLGHDGPVRLFVDGRSVLTDSRRGSASVPACSLAAVELAEGTHEVLVALDTDEGRCTGFYFSFELPESERAEGNPPRFPAIVDAITS